MNVNVQMEQGVAWLSVEGGLMGVVSGVFSGVVIVLVVKRLLLSKIVVVVKKVKDGSGTVAGAVGSVSQVSSSSSGVGCPSGVEQVFWWQNKFDGVLMF